MRDIEETIEELNKILDELRNRPNGCVILIEGKKDQVALALLNVEGEMVQVQGARGIFRLAEGLSRDKKTAIIMTDWDRKGGQLAGLLRNALNANQVKFNDTLRSRLSKIAKKEIKDVESLPSFVSFLAQNRKAIIGA